jgi:hypothetical protein
MPLCGNPRKWRLNLKNSNYCGRGCTQQRKVLGITQSYLELGWKGE